MTNLKIRITKFLEARGKTFEDLARYLKVSDKELEDAIENTHVNIRTLEDISKVLRIPLYSFFNFPKSQPTDFLDFYTERLPDDNSPVHVADEKEKLEKSSFNKRLGGFF